MASPEPVVLRIADRFAQGAYADVFHRPAGRVAKLVRRKSLDPDGRAVRALFQAETAGFRAAHADPAVSSHVAAYFGSLPVDSVIDRTGRFVTDRYWPDCCYSIEYLAGEERKVFGVPESMLSFVYDLLERLETRGRRLCCRRVGFRLAVAGHNEAD
jgi:hypothetical protein